MKNKAYKHNDWTKTECGHADKTAASPCKNEPRKRSS